MCKSIRDLAIVIIFVAWTLNCEVIRVCTGRFNVNIFWKISCVRSNRKIPDRATSREKIVVYPDAEWEIQWIFRCLCEEQLKEFFLCFCCSLFYGMLHFPRLYVGYSHRPSPPCFNLLLSKLADIKKWAHYSVLLQIFCSPHMYLEYVPLSLEME